MEKTATFRVLKSEILSTLKTLHKIEKIGKKKGSTLEVTVKKNSLELVIPGAQLYIGAISEGSAKFTINLGYFLDIINSEKDKELNFIIVDKGLKLRGFTFNVQTTFLDSDRILRSIDLPIGYQYLDLVKLYLSEKYTYEEIRFNHLDDEIVEAIDKLKADIDRVTSTLKTYGFRTEDVEELIKEKFK